MWCFIARNSLIRKGYVQFSSIENLEVAELFIYLFKELYIDLWELIDYRQFLKPFGVGIANVQGQPRLQYFWWAKWNRQFLKTIQGRDSVQGQPRLQYFWWAKWKCRYGTRHLSRGVLPCHATPQSIGEPTSHCTYVLLTPLPAAPYIVWNALEGGPRMDWWRSQTGISFSMTLPDPRTEAKVAPRAGGGVRSIFNPNKGLSRIEPRHCPSPSFQPLNQPLIGT